MFISGISRSLGITMRTHDRIFVGGETRTSLLCCFVDRSLFSLYYSASRYVYRGKIVWTYTQCRRRRDFISDDVEQSCGYIKWRCWQVFPRDIQLSSVIQLGVISDDSIIAIEMCLFLDRKTDEFNSNYKMQQAEVIRQVRVCMGEKKKSECTKKNFLLISGYFRDLKACKLEWGQAQLWKKKLKLNQIPCAVIEWKIFSFFCTSTCSRARWALSLWVCTRVRMYSRMWIFLFIVITDNCWIFAVPSPQSRALPHGHALLDGGRRYMYVISFNTVIDNKQQSRICSARFSRSRRDGPQ